MSTVGLTTFVLVAFFLALSLLRRSTSLPNPLGSDVNVQIELGRAALEKRGPWEVFHDLTKRYGSVYSFSLRGTPTLVLGTAKAAWELLEKRGDIYSSRPRLVTAHEILSGGLRGLSSPYGDYWRKWRKVQHLGMNARQAVAYRDHQALEAAILLRDLHRNVDSYYELTEKFAASIVLSISYGRRASSLNDDIVKFNMKSIEAFGRAAASRGHIADAWPILLKLPRSLQWFRREQQNIFESDLKFYRSLVASVRQRTAVGLQKDCMTSRALADAKTQLSEDELAYVVSAPFGAGVHTTQGSIQYAILAALLYPETVREIQAELDSVVGRDRLPTFADEQHLNYFAAWIKEVERLWPVVPAAVPHSVSRNDSFLGRQVPKGTTVYANIWTMMKDPEMFPEPGVFNPRRFMADKEQELDSRLRDFTLPFGFGRRQCPGMHVASQSIFIVIARLLWTFNVTPAEGVPVPDPNAYISMGLSILPAPFRFTLQPRFPDAVRVLEMEASEADIRVKEWE